MELATCVGPDAQALQQCCGRTVNATVVDGKCTKIQELDFISCYNNLTSYTPTNDRFSLAKCLTTVFDYSTCQAGNATALAACCQAPNPGKIDGSKCVMAGAAQFYQCYANLTGITINGGEGASCMPSMSVPQPAGGAIRWKARYGFCVAAAATALVSQVL